MERRSPNKSDPFDANFGCPKCGSADLEYRWSPPSYSIKCSKCGWAVATSRFPPIYKDPTIFRVFLVPRDSNALRSLQITKAYYGGTTPEARRLLAQEQLFLFEGTAVKIFQRIESLRSEGIKLQIEPHFKYTRADLMGMNPG